MKLTRQQKQLREALAITLARGNPTRGRKWAVRESRRLVREALADVGSTTATAEDLTKLDTGELTGRLLSAWSQ
jgi:hypothetical protein